MPRRECGVWGVCRGEGLLREAGTGFDRFRSKPRGKPNSVQHQARRVARGSAEEQRVVPNGRRRGVGNHVEIAYYEEGWRRSARHEGRDRNIDHSRQCAEGGRRDILPK